MPAIIPKSLMTENDHDLQTTTILPGNKALGKFVIAALSKLVKIIFILKRQEKPIEKAGKAY